MIGFVIFVKDDQFATKNKLENFAAYDAGDSIVFWFAEFIWYHSLKNFWL